jgi:predicted transglutaminase-like cysteine proteinase
MGVVQGLLRGTTAAALAITLSTLLPAPVAAGNEGAGNESAGRGWPQTTAAGPSFFGSVETRSTDLTPVAKWRAVLDRHTSDLARADGCRAGAACLGQEWAALVGALRPLARSAQLARVTAALNAMDYVTDRANWGVNDYWQTPAELMIRGGDCEDFAIAKYLALRAAGWAAEDLRVVIVIDERRAVAHAVLIASHAGKAWVLDNWDNDIIETDAVHHYRPVFSISETAWWWHHPVADGEASETVPASR